MIRLLTDETWPHSIYGDFDAAPITAFMTDLENDFAESVLRLGTLGLNGRARQKYTGDATGWKKSRSRLNNLEPVPLIDCWQSLAAAD